MEFSFEQNYTGQHLGDTGLLCYGARYDPSAGRFISPDAHMQAHTVHNSSVYYADDAGLVVCQYIPTQAVWRSDYGSVQLNFTRGAGSA